MGASFNNAALIKHDDLICLEYRVQAVCDCDDSPPTHQSMSRFFDVSFRFRVEAGSRFVEDQDGCINEKCTCKSQPLRLSTGEAGAAFTDQRFRIFVEEIR